jgi:hypothetical protein
VRGQRAILVSLVGYTATLLFPNRATLANVPLRDWVDESGFWRPQAMGELREVEKSNEVDFNQSQSHRIPNAFMRELRVVGFIPSFIAAPSIP